MVDRDWPRRQAADDSAAAGHAAGPDDTVPEQWDEQPTSLPRLARGVRWSDILAEIERDNELRDAA